MRDWTHKIYEQIKGVPLSRVPSWRVTVGVYPTKHRDYRPEASELEEALLELDWIRDVNQKVAEMLNAEIAENEELHKEIEREQRLKNEALQEITRLRNIDQKAAFVSHAESEELSKENEELHKEIDRLRNVNQQVVELAILGLMIQ